MKLRRIHSIVVVGVVGVAFTLTGGMRERRMVVARVAGASIR